MERCKTTPPELYRVDGRLVRCLLHEHGRDSAPNDAVKEETKAETDQDVRSEP